MTMRWKSSINVIAIGFPSRQARKKTETIVRHANLSQAILSQCQSRDFDSG
jgi:hypothetical protein